MCKGWGLDLIAAIVENLDETTPYLLCYMTDSRTKIFRFLILCNTKMLLLPDPLEVGALSHL